MAKKNVCRAAERSAIAGKWTTRVAEREHNVPKNRYSDILPCTHNFVTHTFKPENGRYKPVFVKIVVINGKIDISGKSGRLRSGIPVQSSKTGRLPVGYIR